MANLKGFNRSQSLTEIKGLMDYIREMTTSQHSHRQATPYKAMDLTLHGNFYHYKLITMEKIRNSSCINRRWLTTQSNTRNPYTFLPRGITGQPTTEA